MKLVLDSSVVAKLFFKEAGSDSAIKLMEFGDALDIEFLASDLVIYEVGNTIWKNLRKKKMKGSRYIKQLFLLNIEFIPVDDNLASEAISQAQDNDITYYDYNNGRTLFLFNSSGFTANDLIAVPLTKEENLLDVAMQPEIQSQIFIERGKNSAFEGLQRLSEVDNIGDLVRYGYGFYKINEE